MRTDPTIVPTPSSTPPPVPPSVANTDAIIVGGGPVGATLAAVLHLRGMRVTVVERSTDVSHVDTPRSYTMLLNTHGLGTLQSVPGLLDSFIEQTIATTSLSHSTFSTDGKFKGMETPINNPVQSRFILRPDLTIALHKFLKTCDGVTVLYGKSVRALECDADGTMTLQIHESGADSGDASSVNGMSDDAHPHETLRSKLVFACDGRNSAVLDGLREQVRAGKPVCSSHGLDDWSCKTPSSDVEVKSVVIDPAIDKVIEKTSGTPVKQTMAVRFEGKGRDKGELLLVCWPISQHGIGTIGGKLASIAGLTSNYILNVNNVNEALAYFERELPQLPIRELLTEQAVKEFVSKRGTRLGDIRRCNSLVAHIGTSGEGGVVLLGDAAHSFPPDLGQGVNCGLEDVAVFANVLDGAALQGDCGLQMVLQRFETGRDGAIDGILYAMRHGFPWQYHQSQFRLTLWTIKMIFLGTIAKMMPSFFSPTVTAMSRDGVSYEEIKRRSLLSFQRLCFSMGSIAVVAGIAAFMLY